IACYPQEVLDRIPVVLRTWMAEVAHAFCGDQSWERTYRLTQTRNTALGQFAQIRFHFEGISSRIKVWGIVDSPLLMCSHPSSVCALVFDYLNIVEYAGPSIHKTLISESVLEILSGASARINTPLWAV